MKNTELYLTILKEWLGGEGIDFARHNINKKDILPMVVFFQSYMEKKTSDLIIQCIIQELMDVAI